MELNKKNKFKNKTFKIINDQINYLQGEFILLKNEDKYYKKCIPE